MRERVGPCVRVRARVCASLRLCACVCVRACVCACVRASDASAQAAACGSVASAVLSWYASGPTGRVPVHIAALARRREQRQRVRLVRLHAEARLPNAPNEHTRSKTTQCKQQANSPSLTPTSKRTSRPSSGASPPHAAAAACGSQGDGFGARLVAPTERDHRQAAAAVGRVEQVSDRCADVLRRSRTDGSECGKLGRSELQEGEA